MYLSPYLLEGLAGLNCMAATASKVETKKENPSTPAAYQETLLLTMGKYALLFLCSQRPLNKQLLLKTYNHKLLLTIMHH